MSASINEIRRRCNKLKEEMKKQGLKTLLIFSQVQLGYSGGVRYISNYHLTTRKEYLIFSTVADPVLIVPTLGQRYHAKSSSWIEDIRSGGEEPISEVSRVLKTDAFRSESVGVVGLSATMPYEDFRTLKQCLPEVTFTDATSILEELRMIKSPEEIQLTQQTADIADHCYQKLLSILKVGENELEVMGHIHKFLKENGVEDILILTAKGPFFPGFIDHPTPYIFEKGDNYIFSLEISGPSGYWTQIIRPICFGYISDDYKRLFEVCRASLDIGASNLLPGETIGEIVEAISKYVNSKGYKMGLWCGHGMGLDVAESPGFFQDSKVKLRDGMVVTLHPHIMHTDGEKGIFLGDTFVVQEQGARNLSNTSCDRITLL